MYDSIIFDVIVEIFILKFFCCLKELNCGQESACLWFRFLHRVSTETVWIAQPSLSFHILKTVLLLVWFAEASVKISQWFWGASCFDCCVQTTSKSVFSRSIFFLSSLEAAGCTLKHTKKKIFFILLYKNRIVQNFVKNVVLWNLWSHDKYLRTYGCIDTDQKSLQASILCPAVTKHSFHSIFIELLSLDVNFSVLFFLPVVILWWESFKTQAAVSKHHHEAKCSTEDVSTVTYQPRDSCTVDGRGFLFCSPEETP